MNDLTSKSPLRRWAENAWDRCSSARIPWLAVGLAVGAALGVGAGSVAWGLGVGAAVGLALQQVYAKRESARR